MKVDKAQVRPALWYATLFLAPALLLLCVELMTRGSLAGVGQWLVARPWAAVMNYGCLLSALVLLCVFTRRMWVGYLIVMLPVMIVAVANCLKIHANGVPLTINDFAMATHVGTLMGFLNPDLRLKAGEIVALVLALLSIPAVVWVGKVPPTWPQLSRQRIALAAGTALALSLCMPIPVLAETMDAPQAERDRDYGLLGGLYGGYLNRKSPRPEQYSQESLEAILKQTEETPDPSVEATEEIQEKVRPNVVMLMSEAFCDPDVMLPGVKLTGDPIPNFHALAQEWPSGEFISNTYAGGTGYVEMEVFTGIPMAFMGEGEDLTTLRGDGVYERLPSIVKAFGAEGYETQFIHNYTSRLYNRVDNLPAIGFDKLMFEVDFPQDAPWEGPYLSDEALADAMIAAFEEKEEGQPLFLYGLTMENHQPHFGEKFPSASGFDPTTHKLDEDSTGVVDALLYGLHGADTALGELVEYLESYEEPVLLIYWGDHLPGLYMTNEDSIFSMMGYVPTGDTLQWDSEIMLKMHTTPFVVWNNYGAELEVPETVSAGSLGTLTLDWAGVEKPRYFQWVDRALDTMLLYRKRLYVAADGTAYSEPPQRDRALVEDYRTLVYDILEGDGYVADEMTRLPNTTPAPTESGGSTKTEE